MLHPMHVDAADPGALPDLQRRFADGDTEAFGALTGPHLDMLYTVCLRVVGSPAEAEDVAQEALCRALDRCRSYDPARPFRPWLLTIALNECRSRLRSTWWRRVLGLDARQEEPAGEGRGAEGRDLDRKVRAALATLPPLYREAVALFHLDDLSYEEMATASGASVPALKQRVRRGLVLLEEAVARLYPDLLEARTVSRRYEP